MRQKVLKQANAYNEKISKQQNKLTKIKESNKDLISNYEKAKSEFETEVKSRFKSPMDCESTQDVEDYVNAYGLFNSDSSISEVSDYYTIRKSVDRLNQMFEKYPVLRGKLGGLELSDSMKENEYAQSQSFGAVELNKSKYSDQGSLKESYDNDVKQGHHPEGTTSNAIIIHEYGHQIDDYLSSKFGASISEEICGKISQELKIPKSAVKARVSEYALTNKRKDDVEFFAEAWAEYICSPNPREIAMMVGKMTEEYLAKMQK